MKYFLTSIFTLSLFTLNAQITFDWTGGVMMESLSRKSSLEDNRFIKIISEDASQTIETIERQTNSVLEPIPLVEPISLSGLNNWITKERTKNINRYLMVAMARIHTEGLEVSGGIEFGGASVEMENITIPSISAGVFTSMFINPGIANQFNAGMEPLRVGDYLEFMWYECIAVGMTGKVNNHNDLNPDISLDIRIQLPFKHDRKKVQRVSASLIRSTYLNDKAFNNWQFALIYK